MTDAIDTTHLAQTDVFAGLSDSALRLVAQVAKREIHPKGTVLFEQGSQGDRLYLIVRGKVRISRNLPGMGEEALAVLEPGASFGEIAIIERTPRSAQAIAHEDIELLTISKRDFEDLLFLHKDLAYEVLWNMVRVLSRRLRATNDKLSFFSLSNQF